jgi:hypothetical protein
MAGKFSQLKAALNKYEAGINGYSYVQKIYIKLFLHLNGNSDSFVKGREDLGSQDIMYEDDIKIDRK